MEQESLEQLYNNNITNRPPKIIGLGKNYLKEKPVKPVVFTKQFSSITKQTTLVFPHDQNINHELELGVVIGKEGKNIKKENYLEYIGGYFLLQDLTDEILLNQLRAANASWDLAKTQQNFLPVGEFIEKDRIPDPHNVRLKLLINGVEFFDVFTKTMCYSIGEMIEYISSYITLKVGDLILTGTPQWGPAKKGDVLEGYLLDQDGGQISSLTVTIKSDISQIFKQNIENVPNKVLAIGKNYLKERTENPYVFSKTFSCISNQPEVNFPVDQTIVHELELGLVIGKKGRNIKRQDYLEYIGGYFLLQDFTDPNMFQFLKEKEQSWDMSKQMDNFLPVGKFIPKEKIPDPQNVRLRLLVNNQQLYDISTSTMSIKIDEFIEYVSKYVELNVGDILLSGTPQNGPTQKNDELCGYLLDQDGNEISSFKVVRK